MNTKLSALWTRGLACFVAILALDLVACGDESDSDVLAENSGSAVEVVSKIDDLPICEDSNEGALAWIKGESTARVCVGGLWFAMAASDSSDLNCSTEELVDNNGQKIICNGDSIGVVLNGNNGAPGKDGKNGDSGSDCSVLQTKNSAVVEITCGSKTVSLDLNQKNVVDVDTVELDSEKIAVLLDNVSGFTQKGPYLSGSNVQVKETQDGRTLRQTGNVFDGKIQNDNGEFKINARMMTSQYVILEANGYYRDEVTGDVSKSELRLLAITDVTMRRSANINLITHLEYNRVLHLVTKEKMKVWAAKRQAQKEIFALLNIDADGFSNSEDLNIAGASDEDGALLAFSILMQGNRTVAQLSEMLTKISADIEKDGRWNDSLTRKQIADWAAAADVSGMLDTIRKNVEGWKLSQVVPRFEHHIRNFWWTVYELGQCGDKNKLKVVSTPADTNPDARYICREDGRWDLATDLEKDTYGWTKDTVDGALKYGAITKTKQYIFDAAQKQWREPTKYELVYGVCSDEVAADSLRNVLKNQFAKIFKTRAELEECYYILSKDSCNALNNDSNYQDNDYIICEMGKRKWVDTTALYVDTRTWGKAESGTVRQGRVSEQFFVYDEVWSYVNNEPVGSGWRELRTEAERDIGLGCTELNQDTVRLDMANNEYYKCVLTGVSQTLNMDKVWENASWYNHEGNDGCKYNRHGTLPLMEHEDGFRCVFTYQWGFIESDVAENTLDEVCLAENDGKMRAGLKETDSYFVCENFYWRDATPIEERLQIPCVLSNRDSVAEDSLVCSEEGWIVAAFFDYPAGYFLGEPSLYDPEPLIDDRDGKQYRTVTIGTQQWMAENLNFDDGRAYLKNQVKCNSKDSTCEKAGRFYTWTAAMNIDEKWAKSKAAEAGKISSPHTGICPNADDGWHIPTQDEWKTLFENNAAEGLMAVAPEYRSQGATNNLGFTAYPTGGASSYEKSAAFWAVEEGKVGPYYGEAFFAVIPILGVSHTTTTGKYDYLSVRCVRNVE